MVKTKLAIPLFLFLFVFLSLPVYATITPLANQNYTYSGEQDAGFDCYNATDNNAYCLLGTDIGTIRKYNSTLHLVASCSVSTMTQQLIAVNDTYMFITENSAINHMVDITNIASNNCTIISNITGSYSNSGQLEECAWTSNGDNIYCPFSDVFLADFDTLSGLNNWADDYWSVEYGHKLDFPDATDNTTAYLLKKSADLIPFKFVNGLRTTNLSKPIETFGIGGGFFRYGIVGDYVFVVQRATFDYKLWRFSLASWEGSPTSFYAFAPRTDQEIKLNPTNEYYNLYAYLDTDAEFGTLTFFSEGQVLGTTFINDTTRNNLIYSMTTLFNGTEGEYSWYALFYDNDTSTLWEFGDAPIMYTIDTGLTGNDYQTDPFKSMAILIGQLFSLDNLDDILALFSVVFSFVCSVMVLFIGKNSKFGMQGFFATFFVMLMMFTFIGWFYAWAFAVMLLVIAFIFFMTIYNK